MMKTKASSLLLAASLLTSHASAEWPAQWQITISPAYPSYPPAVSVRQPHQVRHGGSDYQPELAESYRQGWMAGQRARHCGWQRDSHGAFLCSGAGWESYFQEGYADGFDGHGIRH